VADKIVLIDTTLLIDLFRKKYKEKSFLLYLVRQGYKYCISAVTEYEIYTGAALGQIDYWNDFLKEVPVLPFDSKVVQYAVEINSDLKQKRKQIDIADLFIAATALANNLPFASLNKRHFERVEGLTLLPMEG
jgi:tRNA(fMet)-specific endonuclease VapC